MWSKARAATMLRRSTAAFASRANSSLAYRIFEDPTGGIASTKTAFLLHGILGNQMNWLPVAQRLVAARPEWRVITLDHRGHGDSPSMTAPHTIYTCANDVLALAETLEVEPDAVMGHSFGGKIAIKYLEEAQRCAWKLPEQVWVLDSLPGNAENDYAFRTSIDRILPALKSIPLPIHSKAQLLHDLQNRGLDLAIAQWLATNLKSTSVMPETYGWTMNVPVIEALFESFLQVDVWPVVENLPEETEVRFVQADSSIMWTPKIVARMQALADQRVFHHVLPNAGHLVHFDNPSGLLDIILKHLK